MQEVIEGMRRLAGPKHPDTLHRRYELACVHERMGQHRKSAEALENVLADQLAVLGTDSHEAVTATGEALAPCNGPVETAVAGRGTARAQSRC